MRKPNTTMNWKNIPFLPLDSFGEISETYIGETTFKMPTDAPVMNLPTRNCSMSVELDCKKKLVSAIL